jgi:putative tryptophan/tyrosine transport system substrate-binding protein
MRRREFIAGLGGAAAWPLVARGQQAAVRVIGFLNAQSADDSKFLTVAFVQSLKEAGYVEGRNVAIEYRWAEYQNDRLPELTADLIRRRVAVIVAAGLDPALAAKAATTTTPIVFMVGADPIALGLVASLNRPGANVTGAAMLVSEVGPKSLQLLHDLVPNAGRFGVLADPANAVTPSITANLQVGARTLGLQLVIASAGSDSDLEAAFASFSQQRVGAVLVGASTFYDRRMEQLAALTARHALPAIFPVREFALAGGLISYGTSLGYVYHQAGIYTGAMVLDTSGGEEC